MRGGRVGGGGGGGGRGGGGGGLGGVRDLKNPRRSGEGVLSVFSVTDTDVLLSLGLLYSKCHGCPLGASRFVKHWCRKLYVIYWRFGRGVNSYRRNMVIWRVHLIYSEWGWYRWHDYVILNIAVLPCVRLFLNSCYYLDIHETLRCGAGRRVATVVPDGAHPAGRRPGDGPTAAVDGAAAVAPAAGAVHPRHPRPAADRQPRHADTRPARLPARPSDDVSRPHPRGRV